jgi:uncharacterized C2H2 Zn-finger protein
VWTEVLCPKCGKNFKIEKSNIEKNNTLFTWGVGWDHTTELKMQENLKSRNLILSFCCNCSLQKRQGFGVGI